MSEVIISPSKHLLYVVLTNGHREQTTKPREQPIVKMFNKNQKRANSFNRFHFEITKTKGKAKIIIIALWSEYEFYILNEIPKFQHNRGFSTSYPAVLVVLDACSLASQTLIPQWLCFVAFIPTKAVSDRKRQWRMNVG